MAFHYLLGDRAAWFALQKSENEESGTTEGLARVEVIGLTGKNRCIDTEEVIENNELGFSDPIGSKEALIAYRADASLTQTRRVSMNQQ
jgi:hypothetical protein